MSTRTALAPELYEARGLSRRAKAGRELVPRRGVGEGAVVEQHLIAVDEEKLGLAGDGIERCHPIGRHDENDSVLGNRQSRRLVDRVRERRLSLSDGRGIGSGAHPEHHPHVARGVDGARRARVDPVDDASAVVSDEQRAVLRDCEPARTAKLHRADRVERLQPHVAGRRRERGERG